MNGDGSGASSQTRVFLTEDILINILLRLRAAICIARFRCVCRSWRILLSDPQFIRRFLFFQKSDDLESLQILFTGGPDAPETTAVVHYSLYSYDTLGLISEGDLPCAPSNSKSFSYPLQFRLTVVGCCGGIFCIADANPNAPSDLILWNPATSETKLILPRTTCPPYPPGLEKYVELAGFGYDPDTNDYKVVRILKMDHDQDEIYLPLPQPFMYAEVYSLRKDSWKKLIDDDRADLSRSAFGHYVYQQREISRNHKCYWFTGGCSREWSTLSFDMSQEVFEYTSFTHPPAMEGWVCSSCFMLKESFVAFLAASYNRDPYYQVWVLLKQGVTDSWTKLLTLAEPYAPYQTHALEIWKEGAYICSKGKYYTNRHGGHVYISRLRTSEEEEGGDDERIEIRGRTLPFQALAYIPTQASLSHLE
ncbi:unnamed protein product [Linum trigynum]|uniref:F-box domain-containing protein n=1 Tax=Linum trigynum TaxID=586398 RepID=A0AAV2D1Z8_9ROSI